MTDNNDKRDIFDMLDKAVDLYEQNKDTIKDIVPRDESITIDGEEPLKQALVDDDKAIITVDIGAKDIQDVRISLEGTKAKVGIAGDSITAEVPSDVNMEDAQAELNNGVLEVVIPREGGQE